MAHHAGQYFGVAKTNENDLYAAMDCLLQHQNTRLPIPTSRQSNFAIRLRRPNAPKAALAKTISHIFPDDTAVHSFCTLMAEHAIFVRNTCRTPHAGTDTPSFDVVTSLNPKQKCTLEVAQQISVQAETTTPHLQLIT